MMSCNYPGCDKEAVFLVQFELSYRFDDCLNAKFCKKHTKAVENIKSAYDNNSKISFGRLTIYTVTEPYREISTRS